jgi:hypothetical protein
MQLSNRIVATARKVGFDPKQIVEKNYNRSWRTGLSGLKRLVYTVPSYPSACTRKVPSGGTTRVNSQGRACPLRESTIFQLLSSLSLTPPSPLCAMRFRSWWQPACFCFAEAAAGDSSFARSPGARQSAFVNALVSIGKRRGVRLPYELLARNFNRIVNELKGVNRVVLNIYTKPEARSSGSDRIRLRELLNRELVFRIEANIQHPMQRWISRSDLLLLKCDRKHPR